MIRYYESFRYGGQGALDKRFYYSNEISVPTENGSNILIMCFSVTSTYNGDFKSFPQWAFYINVLQLNTNNKIIIKITKRHP
jgi:hypothetical protein